VFEQMYRAFFNRHKQGIAVFQDEYGAEMFMHGVILDLGCGRGRHPNASSHVIGLDVSWELCKIAKAKEYSDIVRADGCHLPFADKVFNGIMCHQVFEHVLDGKLFLSEAQRTLKSNGRMVISSPRRSRFRKHQMLHPGHAREYSLKEFESLLREYFEVIDVKGYGLEIYFCLDSIFPFIPAKFYHRMGARIKTLCRFMIAEVTPLKAEKQLCTDIMER